MVGHTGDIEATIVACKAADEAVKVSTDSGVVTPSPSIPSITKLSSIELTLWIPVIIMFKEFKSFLLIEKCKMLLEPYQGSAKELVILNVVNIFAIVVFLFLQS